MDKIYSRRRLLIPKFNISIFNKNNKDNKIKVKIIKITIVIFIIFTFSNKNI